MKAILSFLIAVCSCGAAYSTTMFMLGLQELSTGSEVIVQAKVTNIVTRWNRDSTAILTYVRMNIDESLCGENADNEIIIQQIGGQVGTRSLKVLGTTTYKVGDENILFLFKDPTNTTVYQTVGLYQGKYRIFTDSRSVQRVAQDIDGKVILCKSSADAGVIETGNNLSLEEFKAKVKTYLSEQSK